MTMGERIKMLRVKNGFTQEQLGEFIGVQKSAIRKYEKGDVKNLKRSTILTLANIFKVSPSYLMFGNEDEEPSPSIAEAKRTTANDILNRLSDENLDKLIEFAQFLLTRQESDSDSYN